LPFFHIFPIISLFNLFSSIISISFHFSTYFSSIFSLSFHYLTYFSIIISISFHYSTYFSSVFFKLFHYSTYFSSAWRYETFHFPVLFQTATFEMQRYLFFKYISYSRPFSNRNV
jgi:hypothetical protein